MPINLPITRARWRAIPGGWRLDAPQLRIGTGAHAQVLDGLVLAGGETSGACVQALGVAQMRIGPQIDPGVPWCWARDGAGRPLHLALKSGNFGADDFFGKAFTMLA